MKGWQVRMATSTHGLTHLIINGYYKCNKAIGKIPKKNIFTLKNTTSIDPCMNCFRGARVG